MSSFNEHIGGRQAPISNANTAFNMGLPNDPQKVPVWVDSYGSEFSRDLEPNVEGGNRMMQVTSSCVRLYKQGLTCDKAPQEACCTMDDKDIFKSIYAIVAPGNADYLLTDNPAEVNELKSMGWKETCNPFGGPTTFCVDASMTDGRSTGFILYNTSQADTVPLYRCFNTATGRHSFSLESNCEGSKTEYTLGYISTKRGGEMLRSISRCYGATPNTYVHSLDLPCDKPDGQILGYVR